MLTLQVDRLNPDITAIRTAADSIERGDLVILPMETAYIIAADARNRVAVSRIYEVTDRDESDPLSLLISGTDDIRKVAEFIPAGARDLAMRYWPGHLALIVDKSHQIPGTATGGKETAFVMVPEHPVALALLLELGAPLAVANASLPGDPVPATALDAVRELGAFVDVVLDAGKSVAGDIPTVVDVSAVPPRVLRVGTLPIDDIRAFLGEVLEVAA